MDRSLKSSFSNILEKEKKHFPKDLYNYISSLFDSYQKLQEEMSIDIEKLAFNLSLYLSLIKDQVQNPHIFKNFHEREYTPVDFHSLSKNLFSYFINKEISRIEGKENLDEIQECIRRKENVILLSNHQAEADPTIFSLLLEELYPTITENLISIAGARVTTDPMIVPFTRGQNLVCVYSKKYYAMHPEKKHEMQQHNSASMFALKQQLDLGGKCVYVAPSGGRDRFDNDGKLLPAPFNADSVEFMRILGKKTSVKTHFFPLALYTYKILPPPKKIKKEIGEERKICHSPVHVNFGKNLKLPEPSFPQKKNKVKFRENQAKKIHNEVLRLYQKITS